MVRDLPPHVPPYVPRHPHPDPKGQPLSHTPNENHPSLALQPLQAVQTPLALGWALCPELPAPAGTKALCGPVVRPCLTPVPRGTGTPCSVWLFGVEEKAQPPGDGR